MTWFCLHSMSSWTLEYFTYFLATLNKTIIRGKRYIRYFQIFSDICLSENLKHPKLLRLTRSLIKQMLTADKNNFRRQ